MISQTSEYALRAVVHLAQGGGGPATTEEIADATRVPAGYLSKILRGLSRNEVLVGRRGIGGGFSLARDPADITVLEVIRSGDEALKRISTCPLGIPGHTSLCAVHKLLDDAIAEAERVFGETTIKDLLASSRRSKPLCDPNKPVRVRTRK